MPAVHRIDVPDVGIWEWRERHWHGICQICGGNGALGVLRQIGGPPLYANDALDMRDRLVSLRICYQCLVGSIGLKEH